MHMCFVQLAMLHQARTSTNSVIVASCGDNETGGRESNGGDSFDVTLHRNIRIDEAGVGAIKNGHRQMGTRAATRLH